MSRDLEHMLRAARVALPEPDEDVGARVRALVVSRHGRRRGRIRMLLLLAAAVAVASAAGFGFGRRLGPETVQAAAPGGVSGAGFLPADGWNTYQRGDHTIAANVPIQPDDFARGGVLPIATLRLLPRHGTVVVARLLLSARPAATNGTRAPKLRIDEGRRRVYRLQGRSLLVRELHSRVGASTLEVATYFGTEFPAPAAIDRAQRQLDRLIVAAPRVTIRAELQVDRTNPNFRWVRLSGTIASSSPGEIVEITARDCGPRASGYYRIVGSARTVAGGSWATESRRDGMVVGVFPTNAYFRAEWDGAQSEPALVRVPIFVNAFYFDRRRTILGVLVVTRETGQNLRGRFVELQRKVAGTDQWVLVRRARLGRPPRIFRNPDSYWAQFRIRTRGLTLRASVPAATAAPCYEPTVSGVVR